MASVRSDETESVEHERNMASVREEETESVETVDLERGDEKAAAETAKAEAASKPALPAAPAPQEFKFFHLLGDIHARVQKIDGYWTAFMPKYLALVLLRTVTALSFVVLVYVMADGLEDGKLTAGQWLAVGLVAALNVLGRLTPFWIMIVVDTMKESLQIEMGTEVIAQIFDLPHDATISTPIGKFGQLIRAIYMNCDKLLPALYAHIAPVALETLVAFVIIAAFYGPIAIVQLFLFAVYTILAYKFATRKSQRNQAMMNAMMDEYGRILATAGSYERAHIFGNTAHEVDTVRTSFGTIGRKISKLQRHEHKEQGLLMGCSIVVTIGFLFALSQALEDKASSLEMVALAAYFFLYVGGLDQYAVSVSNLRVGVYEYMTLYDFINELSDVVDAPGATPIRRSEKPAIEFKDVSFSYGGRQILDSVSFKVEKGQTLGLVGASGCGKSTVLKLLLRFCRASSGTILVDGRDVVKDVTGESLLELFSVVSQSANIFGGTIRDNIAYGKLGATDAEILEAAKLAELDLESGDLCLDKDVGENGGKLSGGQQQRVSLARAMLKHGCIYLLDEPTTGLDGMVAKSLQATLDRISQDGTTICVTHHLEDLQAADQILYLDSGRIVERGTFAELVAAGGVFAQQVEARRS